MSFMLTTEQIKAKTKRVTRRVGWWHLRKGDVICAVEKGMGLKAGEKIKRLGMIRVIDTRYELLDEMVRDIEYGRSECVLEGFGEHPDLKHPPSFVSFFCKSHKGCTPQTVVNRIEFEYL